MAASDALTSAPGGYGPGAPPTGDPWTGTGVRFPLRPLAAGAAGALGALGPGTADGGRPGALAWLSGTAVIRQSIETILDTEPGERVMRPTFGCGLRRHLMAPNTPATRAAISADTAEALTRWEPRIRVTGVAVTPGEEPSMVWIDIGYVRLADLRPDNLVYPFYLR
ncbi:GPW/gp25 family protein [Streptomyces sp. NBC_00536]|uniref:GPW/gp25 family protein n=1 Tax=Streptomyces sp. NBC_00536 TaxID=2975769 RepID=UPI002E823307|nr:GPW/gp25 family protein [Streptomyces sp. NBC_00536]WUC82737.1 GPW/gp25 family protein [Streptomyces sp. NBC_00536]